MLARSCHSGVVGLMLVSLGCSVPMTTQRMGDIALKACPTGHEFEEVGAMKVPAIAGTVSVRYNDNEKHPLPNATVSVTRLRDLAVFSARTREDGSFSLDQVRSGSYRLTVCAEGFVTLEATVVLDKKAKAIAPADLETRLDW